MIERHLTRNVCHVLITDTTWNVREASIQANQRSMVNLFQTNDRTAVRPTVRVDCHIREARTHGVVEGERRTIQFSLVGQMISPTAR